LGFHLADGEIKFLVGSEACHWAVRAVAKK
jgi:hypothetical protein